MKNRKPSLIITDKEKIFMSENYNMIFDMETGNLMRWGKTKEDDPDFCPYSPEILDIEISDICHGIGSNGDGIGSNSSDPSPCRFCYKSNTGHGKNMSFETFKKIIDKFPKILGQCALGIGDIDSNPDLWKMMEYARSVKVIPNITINGWNLTDEYALKLSQLCGAVSVSRYSNKDLCYNAVKKLTDLGMTQINIHQIASSESMNDCYELIEDCNKDERLKKLNAVVFLMLKNKGRAKNIKKIDFREYSNMINCAIDSGVKIGMDSCSASLFQKSIKDRKEYNDIVQMIDSCESFMFSLYVNVEGKVFSCSFCEGEKDVNWDEGLDILKADNFLKDIWYHEKAIEFRKKLRYNLDENGCRKCPAFDI